MVHRLKSSSIVRERPLKQIRKHMVRSTCLEGAFDDDIDNKLV